VLRDWKWKEGAPRVVADLLIVQVAAVASLFVVALSHLHGPRPLSAADLAGALARYYLGSFLPLSPVFPVVFLFHGFYTRSRGYATPYKWRALTQGATTATLVFLFANFLVTRADQLPRSASLLFIVLVNAGAVGARILKHALVDTASQPRPAGSEDGPVLVVGGAGYIGSILCRKLLAAGRRVRVLDRLVYGNSAIRDLIGRPGFELVIGDCRNIQSVVSAVNGASAVVHLAAIVGDPACEQDRKAALEINFAATRMMIEIAKGYGVKRFLFASSCSVYGASETMVDEQSEVAPISLYAQTKVDSEQALLESRNGHFHPTILRLATVFGNSFRPRFDLAVNLLTAKALQDGTITIYNGQQWRPFIHVSDVAEGFLTVLNAPLGSVSGEIFNLGDSRMNFTLSEVAEKIREIVPGVRIEQVDNPDRRNYRVSFEKAQGRLGFSSRLGLEDGIHELKRAISEGEIPDYTDPLYHNQRFLKAAGRLISKEEIDTQVMAAFAIALQNQQA
jgi:nucleoside-diphosphate-sugar epimerase